MKKQRLNRTTKIKEYRMEARESRFLLIADDLLACQEVIDYINANTKIILLSAMSNTLMWQISHDETDDLNQKSEVENKTNIDKQKGLINHYSLRLDALEMKSSLSGRQYILEALLLLSEGAARIQVCQKVALKHGKSEESIRAAMRRAIKATWELTPKEILQKNYTAKIYTNKKAPTVMEFLSFLYNYN